VAWLFSSNKRAIKPRIVAWGLGLQFAFALLVLKTDFGKVFQAIGVGVNAMLGYTEAGSTFVFGPLGKSSGRLASSSPSRFCPSSFSSPRSSPSFTTWASCSGGEGHGHR
jgi:hypothetical protein